MANELYPMRIAIPNILSRSRLESAFASIDSKIDDINYILTHSHLPFELSIAQNIGNTVEYVSNPNRSEIYLSMALDVFRGDFDEAVFPLFLQNVDTVHIVVLRINSFGSYNLAYNNINFTASEIKNHDFEVDGTDYWRYTFDVSSKKLKQASQVDTSYIDYDLDFSPGQYPDYSQTNTASINGNVITYVPVPVSNKGVYRVFMTGEALHSYNKLPESFNSLASSIQGYPEWNDLLIKSVNADPLLARDSQVIGVDIKSTEADYIIEIGDELISGFASASMLEFVSLISIIMIIITFV